MQEPLVSLCVLTLDRYQMTRYAVEHAIKNAGHSNIELLILDNGSTDRRVINWAADLIHEWGSGKVFTETSNIGVAAGYNKLLRAASGDYLCYIGNDMLLSDNWLKDMISFNKNIENSGITAIHCLLDKGEFNGQVYVPKSGMVYSNHLFSRKVLQDVGVLNEIFKYGYDDSEYCFRCLQAGYMNYYIPNHCCIHLGEDFNQDTEYRKMKSDMLERTKPLFKASIEIIRETGNYKIPL